MANEAKKVIFLDRDGPINVDYGYVHEISKWEWSPGAKEGMKALQEAGFLLTVVTNQSAIANGSYEIKDMEVLHDFMKSELTKEGITISAIGFCPHGRDQGECDCRKPKIGMAKQIEAQIGAIDYAASWTVGDKEIDVGFGKAAGTKTALLKSRYWEPEKLTNRPDVVADNLLDAAQKILNT